MTVKGQLLQMIDFVPESELPILLEIVRRFVPVDVDDIAAEDDLKAHRAAMEEYANGKTIAHDAIPWDGDDTPNAETIAALQEGDEMLRTSVGPGWTGSTEELFRLIVEESSCWQSKLVDMLPESDQTLALELIRKLILAWDPDYTKTTPAEAAALEQAVRKMNAGDYLTDDEICWD